MFLAFLVALSASELIYVVTAEGVLEIHGDGNITSADIEEKVKVNFSSIDIKGNVQTIKANAFRRKEKILKIKLNSQLKTIERQAFAHCTALETINFPDDSTIEEVGIYAFESTGIKSLVFPASIKIISSSAFYNCWDLTTLEFLGTPDDFDVDSVCSCSKLQEIKFPADSPKYTIINKVLYTKDKSILLKVMPTITSYTFPTSVSVIGEYALESSAVSSIVIPETIKEIRNHAFASASKIVEITVPSSVNIIEASAFLGIPNLYKLVIEATISCVHQFFARNCQKLSTLSLPQSIVIIEQVAFESCLSLGEIKIPSSCQFIHQSAFKNSGVTKIEFPASMISIGSSAFALCNLLTEVALPESIESLGINIFGDCMNLTKVTLPLNVDALSERCFYKCPLQTIDISDTIKTIGREAFFKCTELKSIRLGTRVETISASAFAFSGLDEVIFNTGLINIESNAFDSCTSLKKIEFNSSIELIGRSAFNGTSISELKIIGKPRIYPYAFAFTKNLKTINFGSIEKLYVYVFYSSGIEDLIIPSTLIEIQNSTFRDCSSLRRVTIQGSIILEMMTFSYCNKLTDVFIQGNINRIAETTFAGTTYINNLIYCGSKSVTVNVKNISNVIVSGSYNATKFGENTVSVNDASCTINPSPENQNNDKKITIIIVASVAGIVVVTVAIGVIICCFLTKKQTKREYLSESLLVKV